ncbi:MAG: sigma-70 family RNA polymerase sigma factor [Actinomycetia bacterium]|nr:sigma-70 family RNA polymerase sigma factor [Actinomycetes bacterium]
MPRTESTVAFDEFYRGTAKRVIHLVYATTGDLGLAQDCAQEAYARAWQQWERLTTYDEPLSWVRTVARRLAISQWRKRESERAALTRSGSGASVRSHDEATVDAVAVRAALATLPLEQREALAMFYIADLSIEQIGEQLQVPTGTVKARLHRGRAALAARLASTRTDEERSRP